ncbi:hypothetical protein WJX72_006705 [[Myrmecia] bisecta]|uniref:J domain-containing protein n=1 Tax=[Myrmecia] bisecta TaxID=41462 RepID=A0AAW1QR58_9CHLO
MLQQKEAELAAMKARIQQQNAKLMQDKAAEAEAHRQQQAAAKREREEKEKRKSRLEAGFLEALTKAKQQALEEAATRKIPFADDAEVQRVLRSKSDYELLQLPQGADKATVRKKYKEMAVALHPDKCKVEHATDAFQRLVRAYQILAKYAR